MKICAITMVYRDYWALSQWYAHYSKHFGSDNLFIVAHGSDPRIASLCPRANVIVVPRDDLTGFDRMRGQMLNSIQDGLGVVYDWVVRTDVDELICLDPNHHTSFAALLKEYRQSSSLFALGLNLVEVMDDLLLSEADAVLTKRCNAAFSGHYSKAWAVRRGTHLVRHGIDLAANIRMQMPEGVYLVHLKYANLDALRGANQHRTDIATGSERGLPGKAWREADKVSAKFLEKFNSMSVLDWDMAQAIACADIASDPVRDKKQGVLRARSVDFDFRTILPEWFKYC